MIKILLLLLIPSIALAAPPTRTYTYVDGETIEPAEVTVNEENLYNYLSRGVDKILANTVGASEISVSGVTAGSYTSPDITIDEDGRITSASNVTVGDMFYANTRFKIGAFTRLMDADSGDVEYTGVGFSPKNIIFISAFANALSIGAGESSGGKGGAAVYGTTPTYQVYSGSNVIFLNEDGTKYQAAVVKTYGTDGFTLTWAKGSTPTTATAYIDYIAFR